MREILLDFKVPSPSPFSLVQRLLLFLCHSQSRRIPLYLRSECNDVRHAVISSKKESLIVNVVDKI